MSADAVEDEAGYAEHVGGVAAMVTACYLLCVGFIYCYLRTHHPNEQHTSNLDTPHTAAAVELWRKSGTSVLSKRFSVWADSVLLWLRVAGFLWWFGLGWVGKWIRDWLGKGRKPRYYMFTHWNMILLSAYFATAAFNSWQYRRSPGNDDKDFPAWWAWPVRRVLLQMQNVMYYTAGPSALFVTVTAYEGPSFWNHVQHLSNLLWMLAESAQVTQTKTPVNLTHYVTWCYSYVVMVWVVVKAGQWQQWPYPFLQTYTTASKAYGTYALLLLAMLLAYPLWTGITHHAKEAAYLRLGWLDRAAAGAEEEEERGLEGGEGRLQQQQMVPLSVTPSAPYPDDAVWDHH